MWGTSGQRRCGRHVNIKKGRQREATIVGRWIRVNRRYNQPYRLTGYASRAIFKWTGERIDGRQQLRDAVHPDPVLAPRPMRDGAALPRPAAAGELPPADSPLPQCPRPEREVSAPCSRWLKLDGRNPQMAQTPWQWLRSLGKGHAPPRSLLASLADLSFLILVGRFVTLHLWPLAAPHPCSADLRAMPVTGSCDRWS